VIFTQAAAGAGASVKVTGPKALVDRVTLENGRIVLRDGQGSASIYGHGIHVRATATELSIEIVAPGVRSFTLNGSGDLYLKAYDQPDLVLEINGSGNVDAQGKAGKVELRSRARARPTCAASTPATPRSPWPAAARPTSPRTARPRSTWPAAATST
jgi:hypothetical protein